MLFQGQLFATTLVDCLHTRINTWTLPVVSSFNFVYCGCELQWILLNVATMFSTFSHVKRLSRLSEHPFLITILVYTLYIHVYGMSISKPTDLIVPFWQGNFPQESMLPTSRNKTETVKKFLWYTTVHHCETKYCRNSAKSKTDAETDRAGSEDDDSDPDDETVVTVSTDVATRCSVQLLQQYFIKQGFHDAHHASLDVSTTNLSGKLLPNEADSPGLAYAIVITCATCI